MASVVNDFNVIVIGGGPAGYTAAGRTAKAGLNTLLIEANELGGVCLNAGCIPTKTLLHTAKLYAQIQASDMFAIDVDSAPRVDWERLMARKVTVIERLRNGVRYQMVRGRVELVTGHAKFLERNTVRVDNAIYRAQHIVIATGASYALPEFDEDDVLITTKELLSLDALPEKLIILSAHPIALGFASIFTMLGVDVHIVDEAETILPDFEPELISALQADLPAIHWHLGQGVQTLSDGTLTLSDGTTLAADHIVYAGPRQPNIHNMNLESIGLDLSDDCINVDEQMRTNLPGIYAIGDVTGLSMWAHTAQRMGEVVAATIAGQLDRFRLAHVPLVVYTEPQLAMVGLTEQAAREAGYQVRVGRLPLNYNGRFLTEHDPDARGTCKVIVDAQTDALLGVHMLGGNASELIVSAAAMLADEFRVQDVQQLVFTHPTVAEVLKDTLYEL